MIVLFTIFDENIYSFNIRSNIYILLTPFGFLEDFDGQFKKNWRAPLWPDKYYFRYHKYQNNFAIKKGLQQRL